MERYIITLEDFTNYYIQGELPENEIQACKDGYLSIIRTRDLKEMNLDGEWQDIKSYPNGD